MTDITPIVVGVIGLCALAITIFLIPYLRKKVGQDKINEALNTAELIQKYALIAVRAVEQMFPRETEKRLQEATKYFNQQMEALGITLDAEEVRKAIEAAVYEVNRELHNERLQESLTQTANPSPSNDSVDNTGNTIPSEDRPSEEAVG